MIFIKFNVKVLVYFKIYPVKLCFLILIMPDKEFKRIEELLNNKETLNAFSDEEFDQMDTDTSRFLGQAK